MTTLSAYELERLENIRRNEEKLETLGLSRKLIPRKICQSKKPKRKAGEAKAQDPDWQPRQLRARTGSTRAAVVESESDGSDSKGEAEETVKPRPSKAVKPPPPAAHVAPAEDSGGAGKCVLVEPAKTGRSTCRGCMQPIAAGELRVGMESWMVGRNIVVWQHPHCFLATVGSAEETGGRSRCKQTKEAFAAGETALTVVAHTTAARVKLEAAGALLGPVLAAAGKERTVEALRESAAEGALDRLSAEDAATLGASLGSAAGEAIKASAAELAGVTPTQSEAMAAGEARRQPAVGRVEKATGKVCWKWAGALCYGTLMAGSETKTHCYARTQKGNTKTLTKGGEYWWQL